MRHLPATARHSASGAVFVSANNAMPYCRPSKATAGFRLRGPWRIYVDSVCPRGLGSLDISSTTNQAYYHHNQTP